MLLIIGIALGILLAWENPPWIAKNKVQIKKYFHNDATKKKLWEKGYELVDIESNIDGKKQKAYFYASKAAVSKPLVVSLHTWGGDYGEYDSLAVLCKLKDINYIHPDFRGANNKPEACSSQLALRDIDRAIDYALINANVASDKIYVIGKSGGGYAALSLFMKSKHKINTVSSWVPITDLAQWYKEGLIRKSEFTADILKCTSSNKGFLNLHVAKERSPMFWQTPRELRKDTKLYIYTGIHDGITGSVPITHSIGFYNKIIADFAASDSIHFVSEKEKFLLLAKRNPLGNYGKISDRKIIVRKEYKNFKLVLFEGGHEMLSDYALNELLKQ